MSPPERAGGAGRPPQPGSPRYGVYVGLLGVVIVVLITVNTIVTKPNGSTGVPPGTKVPPFAVPLALSKLEGDADVAVHPDEGSAGKHAACTLRGSEILNICQLYERGPVVLALFVNAGSCPRILSDMQRLAGEFPTVRFAAVEMKGSRSDLRKLVRSKGITLPVGFDRSGDLAPRYMVASCPQVSFIYQGGIVQSRALLSRPPLQVLRSRVQELLSASKARAGA
jgi:hypothetical protein